MPNGNKKVISTYLGTKILKKKKKTIHLQVTLVSTLSNCLFVFFFNLLLNLYHVCIFGCF